MTTKRDVIQLGAIYQRRKLGTYFGDQIMYGVNLEEFRKISEDCEVDESLTSRYVKARDNLKELMVEDRGFRQRQGTKINLE